MAPPDPNEQLAAPGMLGTNHLQSSVDSLKRTIDNLNRGLAPLVPQLQSLNRYASAGGIGQTGAGAYPTGSFWGNNGGRGPLGGRQQPKTSNGGGGTFSGQGGGQTGTGGGTGGGGGQQGGTGGQGGGGQQGGVVKALGGGAGIALGAGMAANYGINSLMRGAGGMVTADLTASQLSLGGANTRQGVLGSMQGQVTGLSMADVAQGRYTLSRGLGMQVGSAADTRAQAATSVAGLINPGIGNAQVAQAMVALNNPATSVKLRGMGIGMGQGPGQHQDPLTLANQILQKIGNWQNINTPDQINFHVDDPNGAVASTLRNWEAHGYLPPGTADIVKEEIRSILIARMNGMDVGTLQKLGAEAGSQNKGVRQAALDKLRKAGVAPESIVQTKKERASQLRDRDIDLTGGFAKGAEAATDALMAFTDVVNKVVGPLSGLLGYVGGARGSLPGGGSASDIGAMSNSVGAAWSTSLSGTGASGGQPDERMGNSAQGVPLTSSTQKSGSSAPAGQPGTQSGSAKPTGTGKKTIKFVKPVNAAVGSGFGSRTDPITHRARMHTGLDFRAKAGTPIHASAAGKVTLSGNTGNWAGNHVIIDHGSGYATLYAHQSRTSARVGASVQQGQIIGYVGSTGRSTGAHLHFEIHVNGRAVDPAPYLAGAGVAVSPDNATQPAGPGSASQATPMGAATGTDAGAPDAMASGASGVITSERAALAAFAGAAGSVATGNTGAAPTATGAVPGTAGSSGTSGSGDQKAVPAAPSSVSGNKAIVKSMAAAVGWTGREWDALYQLVMHESGFKNIAQNPTSTARGLFQFLNGTWKPYGPKTDDPRLQTKYGLAYIKDRYGTPSKAWSKWQSRSPHWYEDGVWRVDGDQQAVVHNDEMVIKAREARQIREVLLNGNAYGATSKLGQNAGGGLQITIEKGAIVVQGNVGGSTTSPDMARQIADAIAQHDQIRKLQEGVLT